jgi:hypothetical protein
MPDWGVDRVNRPGRRATPAKQLRRRHTLPAGPPGQAQRGQLAEDTCRLIRSTDGRTRAVPRLGLLVALRWSIEADSPVIFRRSRLTRAQVHRAHPHRLPSAGPR